MALLTFGVLLVGFTLAERRLERRWLTAPLVFTAAGWLAAALAGGERPVGLEAETVRVLAEATLALLLFHDASKLRLRELRAEWGLVARLLLVGLPLTVLSGYGAVALLLPGLGVGLTLFVASALAPTDAALGAATVANPAIPSRIRNLLNAESGLNDGLATPVVLFALALAAGNAGPGGAVRALVIGLAVGAGVGWLGGRAVALASARDAITVVGRGIVLLTLPVVGYVAASVLSGNGFVAAFACGLAFAAGAGRLAHEARPETALEAAVGILGPAVWFVFGASVGPIATAGLGWGPVVVAVLSLTVLRMAPVAIALLGSGLRRQTVAFVGWFGPRGLASLVFLLLSIEELGAEGGIVDDAHVVAVVTIGVTVLGSVVAHGLSSTPLAARYGAWVARERPTAETDTSPS